MKKQDILEKLEAAAKVYRRVIQNEKGHRPPVEQPNPENLTYIGLGYQDMGSYAGDIWMKKDDGTYLRTGHLGSSVDGCKASDDKDIVDANAMLIKAIGIYNEGGDW